MKYLYSIMFLTIFSVACDEAGCGSCTPNVHVDGGTAGSSSDEDAGDSDAGSDEDAG